MKDSLKRMKKVCIEKELYKAIQYGIGYIFLIFSLTGCEYAEPLVISKKAVIGNGCVTNVRKFKILTWMRGSTHIFEETGTITLNKSSFLIQKSRDDKPYELNYLNDDYMAIGGEVSGYEWSVTQIICPTDGKILYDSKEIRLNESRCSTGEGLHLRFLEGHSMSMQNSSCCPENMDCRFPKR